MAFWNTGKKSEYDEYDSEGYYAQGGETVGAAEESSQLGISGGNIELKVARPSAYSEVSTIADYLLSGCTVFLNLDDTDPAVSRRILDFLSGIAYALEGQMKRVATSTFIISPKNVNVDEAADGN